MKLTVKPLKQKDAGRGLAAIDRAAMEELGLENGDYIVMDSGDSRAVARVWPGYPEDEGKGVIRIDGRLRQEADVGIDDGVAVEAADVSPAKQVTVALPQNLRIRGNIGPHIRDKLSGQAVTKGQRVPFSLGLGPLSSMSGQKIPIRIAETDPSGTVVVTDSTEIQVSERPAGIVGEQCLLIDAVVDAVVVSEIPGLVTSLLEQPGFERAFDATEAEFDNRSVVAIMGIDRPRPVDNLAGFGELVRPVFVGTDTRFEGGFAEADVVERILSTGNGIGDCCGIVAVTHGRSLRLDCRLSLLLSRRFRTCRRGYRS